MWRRSFSLVAFLLLASCAYGQTGCDSTLSRHIYHPARLVASAPCATVTGIIMDATHGKRVQGCRVEADGDYHCWLKLDPRQEQYINAENKAKQDGNLVWEPICQHKVTQADALAACKGFHQNINIPPPGSHVRMTGVPVLDKQHGHMEIHPVTSIEVLAQ